jgi:DNA-binding GntR family transcriptional regulator
MTRITKDQCFEDIAHRILATELAPGAALDEASLAAHYGLSRTPLREVLQRLAGQGYIRSEENRGSKVSSLDLASLRVFFQTAPMIYANVARLAAEQRTEAQLDALKDAQRAFAQATQAGAAQEAALANHRFHAVISDMADNPYLAASMSRLQIDHTRMSHTFYRAASEEDAQRISDASAQHDAMIGAIEARDAGRAVDLTLQHWDLSRDRMEEFVRPDPLPVDVVKREGHAHAV